MRAAVLLAALSLAGCQISAQVDTIERTFAPLTFQGAGAHVFVSYTRELKLELGNSLPKIITELEMRRAVIRPVAGVSKLDFISSLSLTAKGDASLPDVLIARFDKGMPLGPAGEIDAGALSVELAPYVQKKLPLEVAVALEAPEEDWTVEITLGFRAASDGKL